MPKIAPKKSIGQHFLHDKNISKKIVSLLDIQNNDIIIEIGPGTGALTQFLLNNNIKLIAYEIDQRSIEFLKKKYQIVFNQNLLIIEDDFLNSDISQIASEYNTRIKVIGNIPYYITSPILFHLCRYSNFLDSAVLMMQKEIYQRLIAKPKTKEYGILTLLANMFFSIIDKFDVPPTCFFPPPKVMSTVVKIKFNQNLKELGIEEKLQILDLIKSLFNQRRKIINNTIQKYLTKKNLNINQILDKPSYLKYSQMRPEELSIQDYLILYDLIYQKTKNTK